MDLTERQLRAYIYEQFRQHGEAPDMRRTSVVLGVSSGELRRSLHSLAEAHELVLVPGTDEVWMAHPFSGIPTAHVVSIGDRSWYANCAWDGLALLALLGDGVYSFPDPNTDQITEWRISGGRVLAEGIVHLLVPAREFWTNIGFT